MDNSRGSPGFCQVLFLTCKNKFTKLVKLIGYHIRSTLSLPISPAKLVYVGHYNLQKWLRHKRITCLLCSLLLRRSLTKVSMFFRMVPYTYISIYKNLGLNNLFPVSVLGWLVYIIYLLWFYNTTEFLEE